MKEELGPAYDGLTRWRRRLKVALEAAREKDWQAVIEPAREAGEAFPQHVGVGCSYSLLASAHDELGNRGAAIDQLQEYESRGGRQPETLTRLARWLEEEGRADEAVYTYEGLLYNWPRTRTPMPALASCILSPVEPTLPAGSSKLCLRWSRWTLPRPSTISREPTLR